MWWCQLGSSLISVFAHHFSKVSNFVTSSASNTENLFLFTHHMYSTGSWPELRIGPGSLDAWWHAKCFGPLLNDVLAFYFTFLPLHSPFLYIFFLAFSSFSVQAVEEESGTTEEIRWTEKSIPHKSTASTTLVCFVGRPALPKLVEIQDRIPVYWSSDSSWSLT